eukprot:6456391-Pyramimonas_sp.AAC.1
MSCEPEVDSAGGEVMQALMCLHTVGGATADTSVPGQMDMFAKSKATTIEGPSRASWRAIPVRGERWGQ